MINTIKKIGYKLKQRWLPWVYSRLIKFAISILGSTYRFNYVGVEKFRNAVENNKCILMFWHNKIVISSEILKRIKPRYKYACIVSYSRDGEIIAKIIESYRGGRTIRVPHNGRAVALKQIITTLKRSNEIVIMTPDGPRGPVHKVKPGIIVAARESGAVIVPLSWKGSNNWVLSTWDKMEIPKPFSKVDVIFGNPIRLGESGSEGGGAEIEGRGGESDGRDGEILRESLMSLV